MEGLLSTLNQFCEEKVLYDGNKSKVILLNTYEGLIVKKTYKKNYSKFKRIEFIENEAKNLINLENNNFKNFAKLIDYDLSSIFVKYIDGKDLSKIDFSKNLSEKLFDYFNLQQEIPLNNKDYFFGWEKINQEFNNNLKTPNFQKFFKNSKKAKLKLPYPLSWFSSNISDEYDSLNNVLENSNIKLSVCKKDPCPANFVLFNNEIYSIDWASMFYSDIIFEMSYFLTHVNSDKKNFTEFKTNFLNNILNNFDNNVEERLKLGLLNGFSTIYLKNFIKEDSFNCKKIKSLMDDIYKTNNFEDLIQEII